MDCFPGQVILLAKWVGLHSDWRMIESQLSDLQLQSKLNNLNCQVHMKRMYNQVSKHTLSLTLKWNRYESKQHSRHWDTNCIVVKWHVVEVTTRKAKF